MNHRQKNQHKSTSKCNPSLTASLGCQRIDWVGHHHPERHLGAILSFHRTGLRSIRLCPSVIQCLYRQATGPVTELSALFLMILCYQLAAAEANNATNCWRMCNKTARYVAVLLIRRRKSGRLSTIGRWAEG